MVDTDRVCAELLHKGSIALALLGVDQGVSWRQLVGNSWAIVSWDPRWFGETSMGTIGEYLPLRKNWSPLLVKNLFPTASMVGRACVRPAPTTADRNDAFIMDMTLKKYLSKRYRLTS